MTAATAVPPNAPLSVVDDPVEQGRWTRWVSGAAGERLGESSLQLSGMTCAACAGIIERAVAGVDGVRSVQVNASAQRATVRWDPQRARPSALIEAVRGAGYDAVARCRRAGARAAPARAPPRAVAPLRRQLLRDAGDDDGHAQLRRRPGRDGARPVAIAGLGQLAADAARAGLLRRALLRRRLARAAPAPHRHGRAGRAGHRHHLRRQHAAPPSTRAASSAARSTSIR